jgi:hypothetical protein
MAAEMRKALESAELRATWTSLGTETPNLYGDAFGRFVSAEVKRWADVVKGRAPNSTDHEPTQPLQRHCARPFPADLDTRSPSKPPTRHAAALHLARPRARHGHAGQPDRQPGAAARSRIAVQTEKSVEALMLYLAVLRAGHVYLPLNTAYQASEIEYFIGNAEPAVVVCAGKNFRLGQQAGLQGRHEACLHAERRPQRHAAGPRRLPCDQHTPARAHGQRPGRHPVHQRHHRAQQGRHAHARQPAEQRAGAEGRLGLESRATC